MKFTLFILSLFLLSGCARAVYNYDYEQNNALSYPNSISVGYYPSFNPVSISKKWSLSAGLDMAYLVVPMGSNVMFYNKNFFAGVRVGDQWSTSDNEVLGAEIIAGGNYFFNKRSLVSLGLSYTTLNLTPRKIVEGNLKGVKLVFNKILLMQNEDGFLPKLFSVYISNNLYLYDFFGRVQRWGYSAGEYREYKLEYKNYLGSFGIGMTMQFSGISFNAELGKVFPRYVYDENNGNPIRYDAYFTSGVYLNF